MKKKSKNVIDLFKGEHFIRWVQNPTKESYLHWSKWMTENEGQVENIQMAKQVLKSGKLKRNTKLDPEIYDQVLANVKSYAAANNQKTKKSIVTRYASMAAAIAFLIIGSVILYSVNISGVEPIQQLSDNHSTITKEAPLGSKVRARLPDGSEIILNAGASIAYSDSFSDSLRLVTLKGEAFFDVKRDETRPFIVQAGSIEVTVLGTSFLVNTEHKEQKLVAVKSGKVLVNSIKSEQTVFLNPGEMAHERVNGEIDFKIISDDEMVFGWLSQKLVFKNSTLEEVLEEVKKWYGIKFKIEKKISSKVLYTAKHDNPTLKEVLENLSHVYNFKYQINGKVVTLK